MVDIGKPAPSFNLHNESRELVSSESFKGKKVVLAFFPAAFSGGCTKEACSFRDALAAFNDLSAAVVGIAVDAPLTNAAFAKQNALTFPLLSDYRREAIKAFDVVHEDFLGMSGYVAAKRSVFVLDADGIIRYKWVAPEPAVLPDLDAVRKAVQEA